MAATPESARRAVEAWISIEVLAPQVVRGGWNEFAAERLGQQRNRATPLKDGVDLWRAPREGDALPWSSDDVPSRPAAKGDTLAPGTRSSSARGGSGRCWRAGAAPFRAWTARGTGIGSRAGSARSIPFQGKEAEAVILTLGAGGPASSGARAWAGGTPNLLNVAATRARRALYVVGNREAWRGAGVFAEAARALEAR